MFYILLTPENLLISNEGEPIPYSYDWFYDRLADSQQEIKFLFVFEKKSNLKIFKNLVKNKISHEFELILYNELSIYESDNSTNNSESEENNDNKIASNRKENSFLLICNSFIINEISNIFKNKDVLSIVILDLIPLEYNNNSNYLKYDYVYETLPQITNLVNFILTNNKRLGISKLAKLFYEKSSKVLYLLENQPIKKNYRKREITISCQKIHYIPLNKYFQSTKNICELEFLLKKEDFKAFLQRSPEFYFKSKEKAIELENIMLKNGIKKIIDSFSFLDIFYNRPCQVVFLKKIVNEYNTLHNKEIIFFPNTSLLSEINLNSISLQFPLIIKPSYSGNHNMHVIQNKTELENYIEEYSIQKDNSEYLIQELIDHEEIICKVYFINNKTKLALRNSINIRKNINFKTENIYSSKEIQASDFNPTHNKLLNAKDKFDLFCFYLNKSVGISLFNIDFLIDAKTDKIYIIEVNYFPSYSEYGSSLKLNFDQHIINF